MAKQEKINFDQVEELDWQANENYPWEYEGKDEVWLADLSKIAKTKKSKKTLVKPEVKVSISEKTISDPQNLDEKAEEEKIIIVDTELKFEPHSESEIFNPAETIVAALDPEEKLTDQLAEQWFEEQKQDKQVSVEKHVSFDWSDNFSWVFASIFLFLLVLAGEIALHFASQHWYWSANYLLLSLWLWRIAVLVGWFYLGARRWFLATEQIMITAVLGQLVAVFASGIYRIFVIKSLWTWLSLVVEPIWMLLIIAVAGSLFVKIINK